MNKSHSLQVGLTHWAIPLCLLALALAIRVPGLSGFITFDEARWIDRSRWFTVGLLFPEMSCPPVEYGREFETQSWGCTLQIGYPGATTMWLSSLGLLSHYRHEVEPTGKDLTFFLKWLPIYELDTTVIAPTRLPFALAGALFVLLFYDLVRRLFTTRTALIASLIVALHPFHIALSRVVHHDALNATFMILALLALIGYWLAGWNRYWLFISACMAGLAFLSKQVGWFMLPYTVVLMGFTVYYRRQTQAQASPANFYQGQEMRQLIKDGILWGLVAGLTFVLLFPAMWVIPLEVMKVIFSASTELAEEGHVHYFLGNISSDPGPLFYPLGWLIHATPVEVIGLFSALVVFFSTLRRQKTLKQRLLAQPVETALALFVGLLLLFVTLFNKKLVRYFLPAFPIIDIFVAWGLFWLLVKLRQFLANLHFLTQRALPRAGGTLFLAAVILSLQSWLALGHYPYYITYHNPLFGSTSGAARLMTIVGWGEGIEAAAHYLNQLPEPKSLTIVSEWFCSVLRPFAASRVYCLNSNAGGLLAADYMVYYYNVTQRRLQEMEQWNYFQAHAAPVYRLSLEDLDYVLIYRNPIEHKVDQKANSLPETFTAFGYNLTPAGQLTLFWQNFGLDQQTLLIGLAPTSGVYPIGGPAMSGPRRWVACVPAPAFAAELNTPGAIIESLCSLFSLELRPGLYDLQLAVADQAAVTPLTSSLLGVVLIEPNGRFKPVDLKSIPQEEEK
jgi:4-amino-4-deoxy-L-arabinose transferase-like glycosyltransferase